MEKLEKLKLANKLNEFKKEIEKKLEPYIASTLTYKISVNNKYGKFKTYVDIECNGDSNWKKVFVYIGKDNHNSTLLTEYDYELEKDIIKCVEECLDILENREYILQEVEKIRGQEEMLQIEKNELLNKIFKESE